LKYHPVKQINPKVALEVQLHNYPPKAIMMGNSIFAYLKYNSRRFIENRIKRIFGYWWSMRRRRPSR